MMRRPGETKPETRFGEQESSAPMASATIERRWRNGSQQASGQTLVEMALLAPFLALILATILHFGAALNAQHVITNAAREGARAGTQPDGDAARMRNVIITICRSANLDLSQLTIDVDPGTPGNPTRATVSYRYRSPLDSFFRTNGLLVRAEAVMRK